jgi:uncharacterized protein (DUF952 family)
VIHHIAERVAWEASVAAGSYTVSSRGVSLADEGFIHCSFPDQVAGVLERHYQGVDDLVLLTIDESLLTSPVKVENGFPHVYGPIDIDAVVAVEPYR